MTQEEKAKAYDKAIEKIKYVMEHGVSPVLNKEDLQDIFPELAESEDERIKKALIRFHKSSIDIDGIKGADILAWLEKQAGKDKLIQELGKYKVKYTQEILSQQLKKQGEQKTADKVEAKFKVGDTMRTLQEANNGYTDGMPVVVSIDNEYYHCTNELIAIKDQDDYEFPPINVKQKPIDMVEPKFNVGDWIVFNGLTLYVKEVVKGFYRTITIDGISNSYDWDIDNIARLWTIADANDGDVLSCDSKYGQEIGLVKKYIGKYGGCDKCFETYCFVDWDGIFRVGEYMGSQNIHPATKEQRDTLFAKIKEAGMSGMLRRKK